MTAPARRMESENRSSLRYEEENAKLFFLCVCVCRWCCGGGVKKYMCE